jgi:hypothetical protein
MRCPHEAEFVVLDPVGLGPPCEHERVVDLIKAEPLVGQRAETALTRTVPTGGRVRWFV